MYVLAGNFSRNQNASVLSPLTLNFSANADLIRQTIWHPLLPLKQTKTLNFKLPNYSPLTYKIHNPYRFIANGA